MIAALFVIMTIAAYSVQSVFVKLFSTAYPGKKQLSSIVYTICYGISVMAATYIISGFHFAPSVTTAVFGLICGICLFLYNHALVEAVNCGPYSFAMLSALFGGIIIPIIVEVLKYDKKLTVLQLAGIAIVLVSIVLLNIGGDKKNSNSNASAKAFDFENKNNKDCASCNMISEKKRINPRYLGCCALLFGCNGIYCTLFSSQQKICAPEERTDLVIIVFFVSFLIALIEMIIRGECRPGSFVQTKKSGLYLAVICITSIAAVNGLSVCLSMVDTSVFYTIENGGTLLLASIASIFIFKEKAIPVRIVGMVLSIVGIIIIS